MKIRMTKTYQLLVPGDVVDFPRGVAEMLIWRGRAEEVKEPQSEPQKPKRGRPRKS